jgi:hypothetical protein
VENEQAFYLRNVQITNVNGDWMVRSSVIVLALSEITKSLENRLF